MGRRQLDAADLEAVARLRELWSEWQRQQRARGKPASQTEAGLQMDMTQGAVSQYLNGKIPLGTDATISFAHLFGCHPSDIRPGYLFDSVRERRADYETTVPVDPETQRRHEVLLQYFDGLTKSQQDRFIQDLQETKQRNDELYEELKHRKKAG